MLPERSVSPSRRTGPRHRKTMRLVVILAVLLALVTLGRHLEFSLSSPDERRSVVATLKRQQQIRFPAFNGSIAYDHLVMVAGHAVTMVESLEYVATSDSAWYLLDYQRDRDLPGEFVAHVKKGVEVAASDPKALLLFSGGQTRADAGPRSEAQSYFFIAEHFRWFDHPEVARRTHTEEYARDSFENLLFAICRFAELTGEKYPKKITVVSFDFKRLRFQQLHAAALRFPNLDYAPMNPFDTNANSRFDAVAAATGESATVHQFESDPYGCSSALLKNKRTQRDPFKRTVPYGPHCPAMQPLLTYCGPDLYPDTLPWYKKGDNTQEKQAGSAADSPSSSSRRK